MQRTPRGGGRLGAAVLISAIAVFAGSQAAADPGSRTERGISPQLPRGGTSVLPEYRPIGFYGAPQADGLGELGIGSPKSAARRLRKQIRPYKQLSPKPIYPVFELIGVIALASPGKDGLYRARQPNRIIRKYFEAANDARALLMLDIQPGRADFMDEVKHLKRWLEEPTVSVALDPEWNMGPHGVPGETIGSVSAGKINRITRYLNGLVREFDLPDKLIVIHQFTDDMIRHRNRLKPRARLDIVINADGFGTPGQKKGRYEALAPAKSTGLRPGFKLFYEEDTDLMSPKQVMRLRPRPSYIAYE